MANTALNSRKRKAPSSLRQIGPNSPSRKHGAEPQLRSNGTSGPSRHEDVSVHGPSSKLSGSATSALPFVATGVLAAALIFGGCCSNVGILIALLLTEQMLTQIGLHTGSHCEVSGYAATGGPQSLTARILERNLTAVFLTLGQPTFTY